MSLNTALAMMVGCVLGVFSTIIVIGLAFAVQERNDFKKTKQEETEQHE